MGLADPAGHFQQKEGRRRVPETANSTKIKNERILPVADWRT